MLMEVLTQAERVIGDKGYDADQRVRKQLEAKGCIPVIPFRKLYLNPGTYDKELYKKRHLIENFFAKLKQYRAIATRYDKTARNFLGAIYLAAAVVRMNC